MSQFLPKGARNGRNVGGAVGLLMVGFGALLVGLDVVSHIDRCGSNVMQPGDLCRNNATRSRASWLNDFGQQQARNKRVGVAMTIGGAVMVAASGGVYLFWPGHSVAGGADPGNNDASESQVRGSEPAPSRRGRVPKFPATRRLRWMVVGVVVVGVAAVAAWRPAHRLRLPTMTTIGAGTEIITGYADRSGDNDCTAGFLVRTSDGRSGLLTAGHCNRPGGQGTAAISYPGADVYRVIGTFTHTVIDHGHDIGLITLDNTDTFPLWWAVDGHPVAGVTSTIKPGEQLCHFGIYTPTPACGPALTPGSGTVVYKAPSGCGDSGGPVYTTRPDGAVVAVGIHIAGSNGDGSPANCGHQLKISIAEIIEPWLDRWGLTVVNPFYPSP